MFVNYAEVVISVDFCQKHACVLPATLMHVCSLCSKMSSVCPTPPQTPVCVFLCPWVFVSFAGCISGCEFPFPVSSPGAPSLADDLCVVFVVELDKGPYGLGMGLIDGLVSCLR
ncbi:hypothetical protein CHARACLAT_030918 [Characodon lateralis]|uniref:Uncharacterized protein n=1 Tax=Characodon lateralis TaxID=208331 RepID=A0ABU7EF04_9TELE|nr:hypothetical protein [Characodon lateralis]